MIACPQRSFEVSHFPSRPLQPRRSYTLSLSEVDQHSGKQLILLRSLKRKLPTPTLADVVLESLVRRELDLAHVTSRLLDTDEIVNVDIGALDVLAIKGISLGAMLIVMGRFLLPACTSGYRSLPQRRDLCTAAGTS